MDDDSHLPASEPVGLATRETFAFLEPYLEPCARVLEIGCGDGHLAACLGEAGFDVEAIDSSAAAVEAARRRGVRVHQAAWPEFEARGVDAIVFTRSLHHIHRLDDAVGAASRALRGDGVVLVEDFEFHEADSMTVAWFLDRCHEAERESLLVPAEGEFVTDLLSADDPLTAWHEATDHELHSADEMQRALEAVFSLEHRSRAPYLYRYFIPVLPATSRAVTWLEMVLVRELRDARAGGIREIGRRFVCRRGTKG